VQQIIQNASVSGSNTFAAIIGFVTLLIGATTVFSEIQDSINTIWKIKVKPKKSLLRMLTTRLLSFSLVVGLGFLLLVSLIANSLVEEFMGALKREFSNMAVVVFYVLNLALTLLIVWFLFAAIFRVLPDAAIKWRDVAIGSLFTAVLFMLAKFGITFYISHSNLNSSYGAAGSLVILLVWVYFSSAILYFGAEFTKHYAVKFGSDIRPNDYAVMVHTVQVESKKKSVRDNESDADSVEINLQRAKDNMESISAREVPARTGHQQ
jgi:membrane protein